jgi:hypothetical protein
MSSQLNELNTNSVLTETCECKTLKNKKCKNKATINGKCKYHNNRYEKIINSNICRKIIFDTCCGLYFKEQQMSKNILVNCEEIGTQIINNKYYCDIHYKSYRLSKPEECAICTDVINYEEEIPLHCGHWFHLNCLKLNEKLQCPMCRDFYNEEEIKMLYNLVDVTLKIYIMSSNSHFYVNVKIPKHILDEPEYGISYIELLFLEIKTLFQNSNLQYNKKSINNTMLNIFKNIEYYELSKFVYNMFDTIKENGKTVAYVIKDNINFTEDNEYTLNYDRFQDILENIYHSL